MEESKAIGTVEPRSGDETVNIPDNSIKDESLCFIYGAIKKYGSEECYTYNLREYIRNMLKYVGE